MSRLLTAKDFSKEVISKKGLAVVQFRTEWNGGCQMMAPVYEELSKTFAHAATFFTIDVEKEKPIATEYGITELPTILFFTKGVLIDRTAGLTPKNILITKIETALSEEK